MFANVDGDQLLGLCMHGFKNAKHCQLYVEQLSTHLEAHDITQRIRNLSSSCQTGSLDEQKLKEYKKIDTCITEGMLAAKKILPHQREQG